MVFNVDGGGTGTAQELDEWALDLDFFHNIDKIDERLRSGHNGDELQPYDSRNIDQLEISLKASVDFDYQPKRKCFRSLEDYAFGPNEPSENADSSAYVAYERIEQISTPPSFQVDFSKRFATNGRHQVDAASDRENRSPCRLTGTNYRPTEFRNTFESPLDAMTRRKAEKQKFDRLERENYQRSHCRGDSQSLSWPVTSTSTYSNSSASERQSHGKRPIDSFSGASARDPRISRHSPAAQERIELPVQTSRQSEHNNWNTTVPIKAEPGQRVQLVGMDTNARPPPLPPRQNPITTTTTMMSGDNSSTSQSYQRYSCNEAPRPPPIRLSYQDYQATRKRLLEDPVQSRLLKDRLHAAQNRMLQISSFDGFEFINQHFTDLDLEVAEAFESAIERLNELKRDLDREIQQKRHACSEAFWSARQRREQEHDSKVKLLAKGISDFSSKCKYNLFRAGGAVDVSDQAFEAASRIISIFEERMNEVDSSLKESALDGKKLHFKPSYSFLQGKEHLKKLFNLKLQEDEPKTVPVTVLNGHTDHVNQVAFLSNGDVATCSSDKTIKVWSLGSGEIKSTLTGHINVITSLALLPNGWLASGAFDLKIKVWDLVNQREIRTLSGHESAVVSLKVLRNGNIVSQAIDDTIKIWNPYKVDKNLLRSIEGHKCYKWAWSFDLYANDQFVTLSRQKCGKQNGVLRVWDPNGGPINPIKQASTLIPKCRAVITLRDERIAVTSDSGAISLFDLFNGAETVTKDKAHHGFISSLAQLSSGVLLSAGMDVDNKGQAVQTIKFWDLTELRLLDTIVTDHSDAIKHIQLSPDHKLVSSASRDRTVKIWPISDQFM